MANETNTEAIRDMFVGRKIVSTEIEKDGNWPVYRGTLTLDDGTVLEIEANQGGCSCSAGDYFITSLATTDNIIMNVEVVDEVKNDGWEEDHTYKIFVYTEHEAIAAVEIEGSDGNGYYGTGFWIGVKGESRW